MLHFAILFELPNQSGVEGYIPLFRIDSNCIWLSCNAGEEPGAVGSLQLPHIDGVPEAGPVGCVVAEPMHSGMISPVNIPSHPVHSDAPGPFELWTLKGTDVAVRFVEMAFHSSCTATDSCHFFRNAALERFKLAGVQL